MERAEAWLQWRKVGGKEHKTERQRCFVSQVLRASVIFVQIQAGCDFSMAARVSPLSSGGAASGRRERRLRSFWKHEQCSIKMALACAKHHSWQYRASVGVQTDEVPAPVNEFIASALVNEFIASAHVISSTWRPSL